MTSPQAQAAATDIIQPRRTDKQIWGIYIALVLVSIVELYSASAHEVNSDNVLSPIIRHAMFLLIGLACMLALQRIHYSHFLKWSYLFAGISAIAMVYVLFFGDIINGARRSLTIASIALQPAEMVKISAALVIAGVLSKSQMKKVADVTNDGLIKCVVCVAVASGLLFSQGLTNTLLLICISLSMMLIGGTSWRKYLLVVIAFGCMGLGGYALKSALKDRKAAETPIESIITINGADGKVIEVDISDLPRADVDRTDTWRARVSRHLKGNKHLEPIDNKNQQEQYSYIAQAHGGVFGVMPGNSRETARLPLAFSDYIYAIVIEEMGLVGGILLLVLYLWLLARAARIAMRCQTAYPALLAIGMAVFIVYQAIFHMAIVTGVFPVSGQPLPLISKGGTSIIITSVALGIMLSVSRFAARKGKKTEIKEELTALNALPSDVTAENPT